MTKDHRPQNQSVLAQLKLTSERSDCVKMQGRFIQRLKSPSLVVWAINFFLLILVSFTYANYRKFERTKQFDKTDQLVSKTDDSISELIDSSKAKTEKNQSETHRTDTSVLPDSLVSSGVDVASLTQNFSSTEPDDKSGVEKGTSDDHVFGTEISFTERDVATENATTPAAKARGESAFLNSNKKSGLQDDRTAPAERPTLEKTITRVVAYSGEPYGVGRLRVLFSPKDNSIRFPDQSLFLSDEKGRVRFPTFVVEKDQSSAKDSPQLYELTAYFLFTGDKPLGPLELSWSDQDPIRVNSTQVMEDAISFRLIKNEWWSSYSKNHETFQGEQRIAAQYMEQVVGCRMGYPTHSINHKPGNSSMAQLEAGFERTVRTLFGFDSVLLSMPEIDLKKPTQRIDQPTHPVPSPMRLRGVALPPFVDSKIESIAKHVPADCFYVRCPSVSDYLWLRGMMTNWGGSLDEIVAMPTLDYGIRDKLERQLAIQLESAVDQGLKDAVGEMALIGNDLLFRDGPTLGVLFEAQDNAKLRRILANQRRQLMNASKDLSIENITIENNQVTFTSTPDLSIRSFHAIKGTYHLVTNSESLMKQFLKLGHGVSSLADLKEFQYARSKFPVRQDRRCFMYLSDPFFRHLANPHHRIELFRRARTIQRLEHATIAALIAKSEGVSDFSTDRLIELNYLPPEFNSHNINSTLVWTGDDYIDSRRGKRGTLQPVSDTFVKTATSEELSNYKQFESRYRSEWRIADPVIVALDTSATNSSETERITIDISVTPYARNRYASLNSLLAKASNRRAEHVEDDLLSIDASLGRVRNARRIHVGLQDSTVPFKFHNGEIETTGGFTDRTLFRRNLYAAITPRGNDSIHQLRSFAEEFQLIEKRAAPSALATGVKWTLYFLVEPVETVSLAWYFKTGLVTDWKDWSVFSRSNSVREKVAPALSVNNDQHQSQVWMHLADVNQSQASDYIRAYTFLESRKASARNAQFLDHIRQQLDQSAQESLSDSELIFAGTLICPLKGTYQMKQGGEQSPWISSAWQTSSYSEIDAVPETYRFPFLDWLHGLDLRFQLDANTLKSNIELIVLKSELEETEQNNQRLNSAERSPGIPRQLQLGDQVVVIEEGVPLMIGESIETRLRNGTQLRLLKFTNGWAGVSQNVGQQKVEGWVNPKYLSLSKDR